jgi:iron complex transport system ATP-binding protein
LDLHHQLALLELLRRLTELENRTLVMSLHDINLAARFCSDILMLFGDGEILLGTATEVLSPENLTRLYRTEVRSLPWDGGRAFVAS